MGERKRGERKGGIEIEEERDIKLIKVSTIYTKVQFITLI